MSHSSFPPELWRRILQEATAPPGGLVSSWDYSPSEKLFRGWEDIDEFDPTVQTKRAIVLVCRQWRTIGIEFLYQWIHLDSPHTAKTLVDVFQASSSESDAQPAYGWWVRRVDVAAYMIEDNQLEEIMVFLGLCDRVEFVLQIPPYGPINGDHDLRLTYQLVNRFRQSLRYVRLRTLTALGSTPTMTLTALTALSLAFFSSRDQMVPDWSFPALRFLKLSNIRDPIVPKLLPFLERHGALLIGLHIRSSKQLSCLPTIISRMITLQSLVLDQAKLFDLTPLDRNNSFPSISHLGIQLAIHSSRRENRYDAETIVPSITGLLTGRVLPGLKVVRLLDLEDAESLGTTWLSLSNLCRGANIVLSGND